MSWSAAYTVFVTALPLAGALGAAAVLRVPGLRARLDRRPVTQHRAWAASAGVWLLLFGYATVSAVKYLVDPWPAQAIRTPAPVVENTLRQYLPGILVATLLFALVRRWTRTSTTLAGLGWPIPGGRPARQLVGWTVLGLLASIAFSAWVGWTQHGDTGPWTIPNLRGNEPWKVVDSLVSAAAAAVTEEAALVAIPVMLLRAASVRIGPLPVTILLLARISYHLYYGWGSLGVLVWGGLFLWIYLARGTLWPLLGAHFIFDAIQGLSQAGYDTAWQLCLVAVLLVGTGYLAVDSLLVLHRRWKRFSAWCRNKPGVLGEHTARSSHIVGCPVHVLPRRGEARVATAIRQRTGGPAIRIGPGFDELSRPAAVAVITREAHRIAVGAVCGGLSPALRWAVRLLALALLAAGGVGTVNAAGTVRGWLLPLTAGAAVLLVAGEILDRRLRRDLDATASALAIADVGRDAFERARLEKARFADPLAAPIQQLCATRAVTRLTMALTDVGYVPGDAAAARPR